LAPVTHDINNPLAALLGRIQLYMARGSAGMPRGPGGLDDMYEQALIVSDKVQTLGTLAREALGEDPPVPTVLSDHVAEITQLMGRHMARRGLQLHIDMPPTIPPVLVRPVDLKLSLVEVLLTLCGAARDPAPLRIAAGVQGDRVHVSIAAEGMTASGLPLPPEAAHLATLTATDGLMLSADESFTLSMPWASPARPLPEPV
jgi:signal transduction histidine kinase